MSAPDKSIRLQCRAHTSPAGLRQPLEFLRSCWSLAFATKLCSPATVPGVPSVTFLTFLSCCCEHWRAPQKQCLRVWVEEPFSPSIRGSSSCKDVWALLSGQNVHPRIPPPSLEVSASSAMLNLASLTPWHVICLLIVPLLCQSGLGTDPS